MAAATTPAPSGGIWSATLTVGSTSGGLGYCSGAGNSFCGYGSLSDDDFTLDGTDYEVRSIRWSPSGGSYTHLTLDKDFPAGSLRDLSLRIGSTSLDLSDADRKISSGTLAHNYRWNTPSGANKPDWLVAESGDTLTVTLLMAQRATTNSAATGKPSITGTATVGQTLTAAKGTIADANGVTKADNGDAGFAYTYQWIRVDSDGSSNAADISGATSSTYTLAAADQGKRVKVKLSFQDDAGNAESRTSDAYPASGTVAAAPATPKLSLELGQTSIAESGAGNATTVKATLPSAASAAVTVTLGASPAGKVTFGAATVTIPSGGTESPTTSVTAVDNDVDAANATVTISGTTASTAVTAPDDVTLEVTDDDTKGVTLSTTTVSVDEGATATYTVKLDSEPTADVVVTPASDDTGAVTVSTAAADDTLTFTASNWDTPQTVTVTGVEDADNADESVTVSHTVSGEGSGYRRVSVDDVSVTVDDDEPSDATPPTVEAASTGYYSEAGATTALTGPLKAGADIYTKVTFSEDMKHVKSDAAAARPELFRRIGSTDTQYHILDSGDTLASGDCRPEDSTSTDVYVCRYTVGSSDSGAFTVKAGTNSVDEAGNALAAAYTHAATLALDTTAPTVTSAETGYFSEAGATTALTGAQKAGADIYTKVTFSEDMKHVKSDAAAAAPRALPAHRHDGHAVPHP